MTLGLDFDNTLASYDDLLHREGVARGLIEPRTSKSKRAVRNAIRALPGGETQWQKLQAAAYGPLMGEARLIDGVRELLSACRERALAVHIVSHKKRFYEFDDTRTDFRAAALRWMEGHSFFGPAGPLDREAVHFEDTRAAKVGRIRTLGCTHFVDDLEETFQESGFPAGVVKILYNPHSDGATGNGVKAFPDWEAIRAYLLHG